MPLQSYRLPLPLQTIYLSLSVTAILSPPYCYYNRISSLLSLQSYLLPIVTAILSPPYATAILSPLYANANCLSLSFCHCNLISPLTIEIFSPISNTTTLLSSRYLFPINLETFFLEVSIICAIICIIPSIFPAISCICNSCFRGLSPTLESTSPFVLNAAFQCS